MDKNKLVHARGFIGFQNEYTVLENGGLNVQTVIQNAKFNRTEKQPEPLVYNKLVQDLWDKASNNQQLLEDSSFREEIIKTAFSAFNTASLMVWAKAQLTNPCLTASHKKFLKETFDLLLKDTPRSMNITTWSSILNKRLATSDDKAVSFSISEYFTESSGINQVDSYYNINSLSEAIVKWIRNTNGYNDLLTTLYILFGKP